MAPAPQQQHTCLGLLIVEARRQASSSPGESWKRIATCYGKTAAATDATAAAPAGGVDGGPSPLARRPGTADAALDLLSYHLETRHNAREDDITVMSACLGRSVYEVAPVFTEDPVAAAGPSGGGGGGGDGQGAATAAAPPPPPPRRSYAPPPACAGFEMLHLLRAEAQVAQATQSAVAVAPRPSPPPPPPPRWQPAAAAAAAASSSSAAAPGELAAFARRFAVRAEKNAAAMYKLLSDIGTGLVRPPSRED